MKQTAEKVLAAIPEWNYGQYKSSDVIKAMKLYANAKLDEAADKANTRYFKPEGEDYRMIVDKQSIISLKDKI